MSKIIFRVIGCGLFIWSAVRGNSDESTNVLLAIIMIEIMALRDAAEG